MTAIFPAFFTSDFILPYESGREALLRSIYCTLYRMQNHSKKGGKRNSVQYKKPAMNIKL